MQSVTSQEPTATETFTVSLVRRISSYAWPSNSPEASPEPPSRPPRPRKRPTTYHRTHNPTKDDKLIITARDTQLGDDHETGQLRIDPDNVFVRATRGRHSNHDTKPEASMTCYGHCGSCCPVLREFWIEYQRVFNQMRQNDIVQQTFESFDRPMSDDEDVDDQRDIDQVVHKYCQRLIDEFEFDVEKARIAIEELMDLIERSDPTDPSNHLMEAKIHRSIDSHCHKHSVLSTFHEYKEEQLLLMVICELNDGIGEFIDPNNKWLSEAKFPGLCHVLRGLQKRQEDMFSNLKLNPSRSLHFTKFKLLTSEIFAIRLYCEDSRFAYAMHKLHLEKNDYCTMRLYEHLLFTGLWKLWRLECECDEWSNLLRKKMRLDRTTKLTAYHGQKRKFGELLGHTFSSFSYSEDVAKHYAADGVNDRGYVLEIDLSKRGRHSFRQRVVWADVTWISPYPDREKEILVAPIDGFMVEKMDENDEDELKMDGLLASGDSNGEEAKRFVLVDGMCLANIGRDEVDVRLGPFEYTSGIIRIGSVKPDGDDDDGKEHDVIQPILFLGEQAAVEEKEEKNQMILWMNGPLIRGRVSYSVYERNRLPLWNAAFHGNVESAFATLSCEDESFQKYVLRFHHDSPDIEDFDVKIDISDEDLSVKDVSEISEKNINNNSNDNDSRRWRLFPSLGSRRRSSESEKKQDIHKFKVTTIDFIVEITPQMDSSVDEYGGLAAKTSSWISIFSQIMSRSGDLVFEMRRAQFDALKQRYHEYLIWNQYHISENNAHFRALFSQSSRCLGTVDSELDVSVSKLKESVTSFKTELETSVVSSKSQVESDTEERLRKREEISRKFRECEKEENEGQVEELMNELNSLMDGGGEVLSAFEEWKGLMEENVFDRFENVDLLGQLTKSRALNRFFASEFKKIGVNVEFVLEKFREMQLGEVVDGLGQEFVGRNGAPGVARMDTVGSLTAVSRSEGKVIRKVTPSRSEGHLKYGNTLSVKEMKFNRMKSTGVGIGVPETLYEHDEE